MKNQYTKIALNLLLANTLLLCTANAQEEPCCGGETYDSETEACCNDEEIYSTEETQTKTNEKSTLTIVIPEPIRTIAAWAGLTLDSKVNTTLNLWEGEDCCDEGVVTYERGTLEIDGNATWTISVEQIPAFKAAINTFNEYADDLGAEASYGGGYSVTASCATTITQKWEDCQRTFEGTLPISITGTANAFLKLTSIQSGNTIAEAGLSGSVTLTATIADWSALSLTWPSDFEANGCIKFDLDVPFVDFLDVHETWGDC